MSVPNREIAGAGFSFALDKIVYALRTTEEHECNSVDVVVCVSGSRPPLQDVTQILRSLWSAKIRAGIAESNNPDEAVDLAKEVSAKHVIMLGEGGVLRVRSWERDQFKEKFVTRPELIGYIQKMLTPDGQKEGVEGVTAPILQVAKAPVAFVNLEFLFVIQEKLTANKKRRYESQIEQNVSSVLAKFTKKERVTMVVVELSTSVLKAFVATIDPFSETKEYSAELHQLIER